MKVTPIVHKTRVKMKTTDQSIHSQVTKWWEAKDKDSLGQQLIATTAYLKESQQTRQRQAAIYARLYGNQSLYSFIGANMSKLDGSMNLPTDRPTFNLIQSASDTLIAKLTQSRPQPVFLTDNSDYKERKLAKQLNDFIMGEFYQTKAYEKAAKVLRDALVWGTGCLKVYETADHKVGIDRVLLPELYVDLSEAMHGDPRQLYQMKLVDRDVLEAHFGKKQLVEAAAKATPDSGADSSRSVSDLVMVVEGWHLPSSPGAKDGRHSIACSSGTILDEPWDKDKFPFVFLHYSDRLMGFWSQGLAEQLMGTQLEINSLLFSISKAIKLVGVPRVFIEDSSKVTKTSHNNDVGTIINYRGTKPIYEVAPCVPQEMYAQLQRLIGYGYQQCGVSALQAAAEKPAGLDSGEAIRTYDDIATDRFALIAKKYDTIFQDLAYLIVDCAMDIVKEQGKYQTLFPNKNGVKQIDLPKMSILKNPFVIQCFNMSSLPRDPAGRMAKITEMVQSGMITIKEGRRLLDYPDLEQMEKLANSSEERIFQYLDLIVEDGVYTPPDTFMDLQLAKELSVQYYNLYASAKLEEEKQELLRNFFTQVVFLLGQAQQAAQPQVTPQAAPQPIKQSPLVPNAVQ